MGSDSFDVFRSLGAQVGAPVDMPGDPSRSEGTVRARSLSVDSRPRSTVQQSMKAPPKPVESKPEERTVSAKKFPMPSELSTRGLIDTAKSLRGRTAGNPRELSPGDANSLLGQVANARRVLASLFLDRGLLPPELQGKSLEEVEREAERLPLGALNQKDRALAGELRELVTDNLRILNEAADATLPTESFFDPNHAMDLIGGPLQTAGRGLKTALSAMVPDKLQDRWYRRNLKGAEAEQEMAQLRWRFNRLLVDSPDARVLLSHPATRAQVLDSLVRSLRLGTEDKARMRDMLTDCADTVIPSKRNVVTGSFLGKGGMGAVYEGTFNGKPVIIKKALFGSQMTPTEVMRDILRETTMHGQVDADPNVPRFAGIFYDDQGMPNIVMERVQGQDLEKLFNRAGVQKASPMDRTKMALHLMKGVVGGLAYMHGKGLVHADLKPGNVMLNRQTLDGRLLDFGLGSTAQGWDSNATMGTPAYMPPEQVGMHHREALLGGFPLSPKDIEAIGRAPLGARPGSDIFSLGTMIYSLMGGALRDLGTGGIGDVLLSVLTAPPGGFVEAFWKSSPEMEAMQHFIESCWRSNPEERPTSQQLLQAMNGEAVTPSEAGHPGLKAGETDLLLVLGPNGPLRGGGLDLLAQQV